jgi:hypothetical protein
MEKQRVLGFFNEFLHPADVLLDFPGNVLNDAFAFQVGIVRQLAHPFLNCALHLVNLPCDLNSQYSASYCGLLKTSVHRQLRDHPTRY